MPSGLASATFCTSAPNSASSGFQVARPTTFTPSRIKARPVYVVSATAVPDPSSSR
jgi:hypothetical protein